MKLRKKGLFGLLGFALAAVLGSGIAVSANAPEAVSAATTEDTLTRADTGVTSGSTSYSSWTHTGASGAVYSGLSSGANDSITLRSKNSNEGIVSTKSGGVIQNVTITWNTSTSSSRILDIYGNTSAYSSPSNLFSSTASTQGTKLGSLAKETNQTSLDIDVSKGYTYIGVRSNSSALYLTNITFTWFKDSTTVSGAAYGGSTLAGSAFSAADFTFTVDDGSTQTSVNGTTSGVTIATDADFTNTVSDGDTSVFANAGTVNLYYKYNDAVCAEPLAITVSASAVAVTGVTLDQSTATAYLGTPITLVAAVAPDNATNKAVTWSSSAEAVATVDAGVVTPVSVGSATITVTTEDGSFAATCAVEVKEDTANSLQIEDQTTDFALEGAFTLGDSAKITATMASGKTEEAAAADCTYTLDGDPIELNDVLATAGTHNVVVSYKGATATYTINVTTKIVFEITSTTAGNLTAPSGVTATFLSEKGQTAMQLLGGATQTMTFSGLDGRKITSIVLSMRSNSKSGSGTLSYSVDGGESVQVCSGTYASAFSSGYTTTYEDITKTLTTPIEGSSVTFTLASTANSIYCQSWTLMYEKVATVDTIEVTNAPTKTVYSEGETFDPTGMEVTAHMSDGTDQVVTDYTMSPDTTTPLTTSDTKITITYREKTAEQAITVNARTLQNIEVSAGTAKTEYAMGEKLDYEGLSIVANYSSGDPVTLDVSAVSFSRAAGEYVTKEDADAGSITVTITYLDKTDDIVLTVAEATAVFTKVTDVSELEIGATYTFGYYDATANTVNPINAKPDNDDFYAAGEAVYSDGSVFLDNDAVLDFTLAPGSASGKYALWSDTESGYIHQASSGTDVLTESTFSSGDLTITFDSDGTANVMNSTRYIGYNSRFAFYANSTDYPVCLYKRYEASNTAYADAKTWASGFLSRTATYCGDNGSGSTIEENWTTALGTVPTGTLAKDFLARGGVYDTTIAQAIERYDYIVNKYTALTDSLNRRGTSGAANAARHDAVMDESDGMIISASLLSVAAAVAGFFLVKKSRKKAE